VIRASVAVPFLVAAAFATAAVTVTLVEHYGAVTGYGLMAAAFTAVGLISALLVSMKEQEEEAAEVQAANSDTAGVASEAATQAALQLPLALVGTLATSSLGPSAAVGGAKLLARNLPLVVMLLIIGYLFWSDKQGKPQTEGDIADGEAPGSAPEQPPSAHAAVTPPDARPYNEPDQRAA
jgi:hypothetical protein